MYERADFNMMSEISYTQRIYVVVLDARNLGLRILSRLLRGRVCVCEWVTRSSSRSVPLATSSIRWRPITAARYCCISHRRPCKTKGCPWHIIPLPRVSASIHKVILWAWLITRAHARSWSSRGNDNSTLRSYNVNTRCLYHDWLPFISHLYIA